MKSFPDFLLLGFAVLKGSLSSLSKLYFCDVLQHDGEKQQSCLVHSEMGG